MSTLPDDDGLNAPTHLSAPRPGSSATTLAGGPSLNTTFPAVEWTATGARLERRELPRYQTLDLLGEGGMGAVVKARDNDIGRTVAVKRLHPDLQHPELLARFVEEVRTVGQLEHPNIVPIHDAGVDDQGCFFVMKHAQGQALDAIIQTLAKGDTAAHTRWTWERRVGVIRKVLDALRYAHARGVIHRDIKPANILVGEMDEVFVLDWGVARRTRDASGATPSAGAGIPDATLKTMLGAVIGTPHYMAPEQARGEPADERSDLYSLCLTLWEFLTLTHPYAQLTNVAQVLKAQVDTPIPLAGFVRNPAQGVIPMDIVWMVHKGLKKDPAERYQTAEELMARMDDRVTGRVPIECHVTATQRAAFEFKEWVTKWPMASSVVMGAAALGLGWLAFR